MKFTTLLPLTDNEGNDLTIEVTAIVNDLAIQFGGCSIEGLIDGIWIDAGITYRDRSSRVTVVCDNSRREEARAAIIQIGRRLRQKAMYFEVSLTADVEIIPIE